MNLKHMSLLFVMILFASCGNNQKVEKKRPQKTNTENSQETDHQKDQFKFWTWTTATEKKSDSAYTAEFKKYSDHGIDAVLIDTKADPKLLSHLVPLAKKQGLEVHAWMFTMNRPGDTTALKHPDWYQVSRSGKSCFDQRPYVDYYQWLSPSNPDAVQHIYDLIEGLAKVDGVSSVHLDYIRYPDVFLPRGLLPNYDLKQNKELADYDFDYSDSSIKAFQKEYGIDKDPRKMDHPELDIQWKQFRLNEVRKVVNHAYEIVHDHDKYLTAAVFPYPERADHMVRQRWDKWNIDMVLPMIYNNFYNEPLNWIGFATGQGVADLKAKDVQLHTGLYVPPMSAEELKKAINMAKENGANGVSFFDGPQVTEEQWKVIKAATEQ